MTRKIPWQYQLPCWTTMTTWTTVLISFCYGWDCGAQDWSPERYASDAPLASHHSRTTKSEWGFAPIEEDSILKNSVSTADENRQEVSTLGLGLFARVQESPGEFGPISNDKPGVATKKYNDDETPTPALFQETPRQIAQPIAMPVTRPIAMPDVDSGLVSAIDCGIPSGGYTINEQPPAFFYLANVEQCATTCGSQSEWSQCSRWTSVAASCSSNRRSGCTTSQCFAAFPAQQTCTTTPGPGRSPRVRPVRQLLRGMAKRIEGRIEGRIDQNRRLRLTRPIRSGRLFQANPLCVQEWR